MNLNIKVIKVFPCFTIMGYIKHKGLQYNLGFNCKYGLGFCSRFNAYMKCVLDSLSEGRIDNERNKAEK